MHLRESAEPDGARRDAEHGQRDTGLWTGRTRGNERCPGAHPDRGRRRPAMTSPRADDDPVAVVGLGYVGLPLAMAFAGTGLRTVGYDIDSALLSELAGAPLPSGLTL